MTTVATLDVVVNANISNFQSGMRAVSTGLQSVGSNLSSLGSQMSTFGQQTAALWGPLAAGIGYATIAAIDFDTAMSNVNSILQLGEEDAAALNAQILEIGGNAVAGPQAVAEAFYDIVGAVSDTEARIPILNAAIAASEAGAADLSATVSALTGAMNAYSASAEDAQHYSDVLTQTVAMGVGTMDEFAAAMPTVTGIAAALGISFDELNMQAAFITTTGTSAAQAYTQLGALMSQMMSPTANLQNALQSIGFTSGEAAIEALGLAGTMQALVDEGYSLGDLGLGIEGTRAAIALTNDAFNEFSVNFSAGIDGATERARAFQLDSASAQMGLLKSAADELAITLGGNVMVALQGLAEGLTPIVQGITDWAKENPELSGTLVAVAGGIALLGVGAFVLGPVIGALGTVFSLLATAASSAAFPFLLIGFAIGGLIAISGDLPQLNEAITNVGNAIGQITSGDAEGWSNLATALGNLAGISLQAVADGAINLIEAITGVDLPSVAEGFAGWGTAIDSIKAIIDVAAITIPASIENFGLNVQLKFQEFISDLRDTVLDLSGGSIDIAPNIETDIEATRAAIQANLDETMAAMDGLSASPNIEIDLAAAQIDMQAVWTTIHSHFDDPTISGEGSFGVDVPVTVTASDVDTIGVSTEVANNVNAIRTSGTINADITLTASVDSSQAIATVQASVDSLAISGTSSFGTDRPSVATTEVPQGASGAMITGEGLMYVHANERLLNSAETESYNAGRSNSGGGGGNTYVYHLTTYGSQPYEQLALIRRASADAAPE